MICSIWNELEELTGQRRVMARDKRELARNSVKRGLRVSLDNVGFSYLAV